MKKKHNMKVDFFIQNRQRLTQALKGGLVVVTAYDAMQRAADMAHPYQQESCFWYLTGIEQPGWKLIFDGIRNHATLVRPALTEVERIFDGDIDDQQIIDMSGADAIIAEKDMERELRQLARTHSVVSSLAFKQHDAYRFAVNPAPSHLWNLLDRIFPRVQDCERDIARLRAIKQPEEQKQLQSAIDLTIEAFNTVKQQLESYQYEYEIAADMTHVFGRHNARHAYDPIVASGGNACTLHYIANANKLRKNHFLLIDVGANLGGYCADITRTYQIGKVSNFARDVHEALQIAQRDCIALIEPGRSVEEYSREVDRIMCRTLSDLGLIASEKDEKGYRTYMPHAISHGLGIDTHDSLGRSHVLKEGMVLTVEPGIYIPEQSIGIRLEDDILVTHDGYKNLSKALSTEY